MSEIDLIRFCAFSDRMLFAQCFQPFHGLKRAFWHIFNIVALRGTDA